MEEEAPFQIGERVERRNEGMEWGFGYITNLMPLKVTLRDDPRGRAHCGWAHVRRITWQQQEDDFGGHRHEEEHQADDFDGYRHEEEEHQEDDFDGHRHEEEEQQEDDFDGHRHEEEQQEDDFDGHHHEEEEEEQQEDDFDGHRHEEDHLRKMAKKAGRWLGYMLKYGPIHTSSGWADLHDVMQALPSWTGIHNAWELQNLIEGVDHDHRFEFHGYCVRYRSRDERV